MSDRPAQLLVRDLRKRFDTDILKPRAEVLRGVNLTVQPGEIYGFLGPNGAGKTTTIKAVMGLIRPSGGSITIAGHAYDTREARSLIGFMPERPGFYNHLSGRELLHFYADLLGMPRDRARVRIDELLREVGMADRCDGTISTYSKGMVQRLALAQALVHDPSLLILDEPMSGLDPIGRRDVRDIILRLKQRGITIFFSSHIIPDIESLCDRVAILVGGVVRAEGTVHDIVSMEVTEYEIGFTGLPLDTLAGEYSFGHEGSDYNWVRVGVERKDAIVQRITAGGGALVSLAPVRRSLEDALVGAWQEARP